MTLGCPYGFRQPCNSAGYDCGDMRGVVPIHPFSYSDDKFFKVIFKFVLETKTVAQRACSAVEMHEIKLELKSTYSQLWL